MAITDTFSIDGLVSPVVGVGISLSRHVSPKDTILGFAITVTAGIAASAIKLVGRATTRPTVGKTDLSPTEERRAA